GRKWTRRWPPGCPDRRGRAWRTCCSEMTSPAASCRSLGRARWRRSRSTWAMSLTIRCSRSGLASRTSGSIGAATVEHYRNGPKQYLDIHQQRPVVNVVLVEAQTLLEGEKVASTHLPQAGNAGRRLYHGL